jgi:pimeloyl-ACP methyl ester carboxylesterase
LIRSGVVATRGGQRTVRVLYHSRSATGADVAVSGLVWLPRHIEHTTPILAFAHPSVGLGDACAPSRHGGAGATAIVTADFVRRGYVVAATDYEGLGTPGPTTFAVTVSEAHDVLDSVRVARALTHTAGPAVVWGYSLGGGAALGAADLAATYAPDAGVTGVVAGAPVAELVALASQLGSGRRFAYALYALDGYAAAYRDVDRAAFVTARGAAALKRAATDCGALLDALYGKRPAEYLRPLRGPAWRTLERRLLASTPGDVAITIPVLVYHGADDTLIPPAISAQYVARACRHGATTITREVVPDADHTTALFRALPLVTAWIDDRVAGRPVASSACAKR